jgi:hypothetical protein
MVIDKNLRHRPAAGQALHFASPSRIISDVDFFKLNAF